MLSELVTRWNQNPASLTHTLTLRREGGGQQRMTMTAWGLRDKDGDVIILRGQSRGEQCARQT